MVTGGEGCGLGREEKISIIGMADHMDAMLGWDLSEGTDVRRGGDRVLNPGGCHERLG